MQKKRVFISSVPYGMTVAKLKEYHSSIPVNPLIAEPMYLNGTIERVGSGTRDIVKLCKKWGLKEPEYIQEEFFRIILWRRDLYFTRHRFVQ
jgi:predicted HTH transcriptional regulator